jgi:hypothetical protein
MAEDEVPLPELPHHRPGRRHGLRDGQFVLFGQVLLERGQQFVLVEVVAGDTALAVLHAPGHEAEQLVSVLVAEVGQCLQVRRRPQVFGVFVPVRHQDRDGVPVDALPVPGQFPAAADDGEDGQQEGIAGQLTHRPGVPDRIGEPTAQTGRALLVVRVRGGVPLPGEELYLLPAQVLDHVVGETGALQDAPPVSDDARGHHDPDPGLLVAAGEVGDAVTDLFPCGGFEEFVQAVEDDHRTSLGQDPLGDRIRGRHALGGVQVLEKVLERPLPPLTRGVLP